MHTLFYNLKTYKTWKIFFCGIETMEDFNSEHFRLAEVSSANGRASARALALLGTYIFIQPFFSYLESASKKIAYLSPQRPWWPPPSLLFADIAILCKFFFYIYQYICMFHKKKVGSKVKVLWKILIIQENVGEKVFYEYLFFMCSLSSETVYFKILLELPNKNI